MTFVQMKNQIKLNVLLDPSGVNTGDQEDLSYGAWINGEIATYEEDPSTLWDELWVDEENAAQIAVGMTLIDLEDDFNFMGGGYVRIVTSAGVNLWFKVKMLPERVLNPENNKREFYVAGNQADGYTLLFGWTPKAGDPEIGAQISYCYYKRATILVKPGDVSEVNSPMFLVNKASALAAAAMGNTNLFTIYDTRAEKSLSSMRRRNEMSTYFQDDYVKDVDGLTNPRRRIPKRFNSGYWMGY
jgi:hypothetical protein